MTGRIDTGRTLGVRPVFLFGVLENGFKKKNFYPKIEGEPGNLGILLVFLERYGIMVGNKISCRGIPTEAEGYICALRTGKTVPF